MLGKDAPWALGDTKQSFDYTPQGVSWIWAGPGPRNAAGTYGTTIDYAREAGDLVDNSAVMACLQWVMRTFPQVPMGMVRRTEGGDEPLPRHPLTQLLMRPNPAYSGRVLWQPTILSLNWDGNAYWRKVRNGAGRTIQLWYEPHWNMRPRRTSRDEFISHYEIYRNRVWERLEVEDVVHFRNGVDPRNDMLGLSPLAAALRDVLGDNEAARYTVSVLGNMGIPGGIVSPDGDYDIADPEALKARLTEVTTGDRRGEYVVLGVPVKIAWPEIDPAKMNTRELRKINEERISALLGVPAVVAGLGAGLDRSTFANFETALYMAYTSNIIPTMLSVADDLDVQLLPEFGDPVEEDIVWDLSDVRALQDNETEKANVSNVLYSGGIIKRAEARARHDQPIAEDGSDDVYKTDIPARSLLPVPEDMMAADASGKSFYGVPQMGRGGYRLQRTRLLASKSGLQMRREKTILLRPDEYRYVDSANAGNAGHSSSNLHNEGLWTKARATARERAALLAALTEDVEKTLSAEYRKIAAHVRE